MNKILKNAIRRIEEQSKLYVRGHKGGGTGHAYTDRKSTNLGTEIFRQDLPKKEKGSRAPVKVSRAFKKQD